MFQNYLKVTIRNLMKYKAHTLINIIGLSIGLASCILILMFVNDELSFDKHHANADRIYRVANVGKFGGNSFDAAVCPAPMAQALLDDYPEVSAATRFRARGSFLVKKDVQNFKEDQVVYADNAVFDVFTIPLITGERSTALSKPENMAISYSAAKKYFPDLIKTNPGAIIGQTLTFDNRQDFQVSAIFEDMPLNGHFHFDFLLSMEGNGESRNNMWLSNNFQTYILLEAGADVSALEGKLAAILDKYIGPQAQQYMGISIDEFMAQGNELAYYLQPLTDIHLHSQLTAEFEPNGSILYVYIFSAIALFLLLIACINFMNLATARSSHRAREVGVRKVLGSQKIQLVRQFLTESFLLTAIALIMSIGIVELSLPWFNQLSGKALETGQFFETQYVIGLFGIVLLVGFMAGSYPAFFLSSFQPIEVLKGKLQMGTASGKLRSVLVVFQFVTTIILIVGTLVIRNQLEYIQNKQLGFNKEQVLVIHDAYALGENLDAFREAIAKHHFTQAASVSSYLPVFSNRSDTGFWQEGRPIEENTVSMQIWDVDEHYVPAMAMEMAAGRNFSSDFATDSSAIIINEKAVSLFGFEDAIGERISTVLWNPETGIDLNNVASYTIVGVLKDFHFESMTENIGALALRIGTSRQFISVRFNTDDVESYLAFISDTWNAHLDGQPVEYTFLDERFSNMYAAEQRLGSIFSVFATLSILVACLGLFGLASFTAEQRTKEIGVRKVLGASTGSIIMLLSKEFTKWVLIANLIAWPIAYFFLNQWLQGFVFRTEFTTAIFVVSGLLALLIAILTVTWQAVKAALSNPIDALRYE